MTCIAAVVKDGHVWMAGDMLGSNGFTKKVYPDSKVFVNGDFIIGYTSSFRMGQILQYNWTQPPRMEDLSDREYLQVDVVESFRSCLNDLGFGEMREGEHQGGNFLIGYKGVIYEMQNNFSILKNDSFCSIGSGQYHAESALSVLTEDEDFEPFYVLGKAIKTASEFVTSVSEEFTIYSTDKEALDEALDEQDVVYENLDISMLESTTDIEVIKNIASKLEINFSHNIGIETLRKRIIEFLN